MARSISSWMKRRATVLISLGATSNAAGAPEGPRIVYRGPAVCPDGIAFLERVRLRTPRADLAHDGEPARFVVTVTASEGESSGRVEFTSHRSEPVVREVFGKTCDEVVSAAALITALAIEATLDADTDSPKPLSREDDEKMASADAAPVTEKPGDSVRWGAGIGSLDLSPLTMLPALRAFTLSPNHDVDYGAPFANLDLSPLGKIPNLTDLSLGTNAVADLAPLALLPRLGALIFHSDRVVDLSPLAGATKLTRVIVGGKLIKTFPRSRVPFERAMRRRPQSSERRPATCRHSRITRA
jgi:hypothetical protein